MIKQITLATLLFSIFSCDKRDPFYDACVTFEPIQLKVGDTIRFKNCGEYKPINGVFYKTYVPLFFASSVGSYVYFSNNEAIGVVNDTGLYNFSIIEFMPKTRIEKIKRYN